MKKGLDFAAKELEVSKADLEFSAGKYRVKGTDVAVAFSEIVKRYGSALDTQGGIPTPIAFPGGAHVCEVEIDPETGAVEIASYVAVDDCGRVMNHTLVEGQLHGGIVQGIGQALAEHCVYDAAGQLLTGSFMDYAMPRSDMVKDFKLYDHSVPSPSNPLGVKGTGEAGTTGAIRRCQCGHGRAAPARHRPPGFSLFAQPGLAGDRQGEKTMMKKHRSPFATAPRSVSRSTRPKERRFPALLAASPYRYDNNALPAGPQFLWRETGPIEFYVKHGFAYVHMDVRGSGKSGGQFEFLGPNEQRDLYDVIEWIARQPWSNGKVGGIGQSYFCMSQWWMGIVKPPALACLGAYDGFNDPYRATCYTGGIPGQFIPGYWWNQNRIINRFPANGAAPRVQETTSTLRSARIRPPTEFLARAALGTPARISVPLYLGGHLGKGRSPYARQHRGFRRARGPQLQMRGPITRPGRRTPSSTASSSTRRCLLPSGRALPEGQGHRVGEAAAGGVLRARRQPVQVRRHLATRRREVQDLAP